MGVSLRFYYCRLPRLYTGILRQDVDGRAFATPERLRPRRRDIGERSDAVLRTARPGHDDGEYCCFLLFGRAWPRLLRAAQSLEGLGHGEHAEIVEAAADNLYADREAVGVVAAVDRHGRVLRHVPRHGVADVLEGLVGIVDWGSELRIEFH